MNDKVPYTWDDPMKIMDKPAMDRFEAVEAVEADVEEFEAHEKAEL